MNKPLTKKGLKVRKCSNARRLLCMLLCCGVTAGISSASASITYTPAPVDLGIIETGQQTQTEVYLLNSGPKSVLIKNVNSSCGCTVGKTEKDTIAPGEKVSLKITIKTDNGKTGHLNQTIAVITEEPDRNVLKIPISYTVIQSLSIFPRHVLLGDVLVGRQLDKEIVLSPRDANELINVFSLEASEGIQIKSFALKSSSEIKELVPELIKKPGFPADLPYGYLLTFGIQIPQDTTKPYNGSIRLEYEKENKTKGLLKVQIKGRIKPYFLLNPRVLYLGRVKPGDVFRKEVEVLSTVCNSFKISDMAAEGDLKISLQPEPKESTNKQKLKLEITVPSDSNSGQNYLSTVHFNIKCDGKTKQTKLKVVGYKWQR